MCGDTDNGFGFLFNYNSLGDGQHTIQALADGVEFGRATFTVTTLGQDYLEGATRTFELPDFPNPGTTLTLTWQEHLQNFTIAGKKNSGAFSITPGKWEGQSSNYYICFNVSQDKTKIMEQGSSCITSQGYSATLILKVSLSSGGTMWGYWYDDIQISNNAFYIPADSMCSLNL